MIKLIKSGKYSLIETKSDIKILTLDRKSSVWVFTRSIGEMLVTTRITHKTDQKLAKGEYRIYDVENEPKLVDTLHLELQICEGKYRMVPPRGCWQGYLLITGLPKKKKTRSRIIPTNEVISN